MLRCHIAPALRALALADVTPARVRSWRTGLLHGGLSPVTVAKAYQLLKAVLNAVDDGQSAAAHVSHQGKQENEPSPERPTITIEQVYAIAEQVRPVVPGAGAPCRFHWLAVGQLMALRRRHLDLDGRIVRVRGSIGEIGGRLIEGPPKSAAGRRDVAIPEAIVPRAACAPRQVVADGADGRVFVARKGRHPSGGSFQVTWSKAVANDGGRWLSPPCPGPPHVRARPRCPPRGASFARLSEEG